MSPGNWCGGLHLYTRRGAGHLHSRGSSSLWVGWHEVVHLCRGVSVPCCLIHVMSRKGLRRVQTQCPSFGPVATMLSCHFLVFHCLHRTAAESWWLIEKLYSSETEWWMGYSFIVSAIWTQKVQQVTLHQTISSCFFLVGSARGREQLPSAQEGGCGMGKPPGYLRNLASFITKQFKNVRCPCLFRARRDRESVSGQSLSSRRYRAEVITHTIISGKVWSTFNK